MIDKYFTVRDHLVCMKSPLYCIVVHSMCAGDGGRFTARFSIFWLPCTDSHLLCHSREAARPSPLTGRNIGVSRLCGSSISGPPGANVGVLRGPSALIQVPGLCN